MGRTLEYNIGELHLHGHEDGVGRPVIFLHGITATYAVWLPIVQRLKSIGKCVAVSQRGHGHSSKPPFGYEAQHYAQDLVDLVECLDSGPAIVVGHSLGARNALVASAARPDLVSAVVAVDFTPFMEKSVLDVLRERVVKGNRTFANGAEVETYLRSRYKNLPDEAIVLRAQHGYAAHADGMKALAAPSSMEQTADGLYEPFESSVSESTVPTIFVRGAESTLLSAEAFEATRNLRPDQRYVVVEDADHYVPEERPDVIAGLVTDLIRDGYSK